MQLQKPKEVEEEIIFISDPSQQIHIHKYDENNKDILENKQILQCVFTFVYKDSLYSKALQGILIRLLYEFDRYNIKELFYRNDGLNEFYVYMQADSVSILTFADTLSHKLPLGLDFTFKDIIQLSIDDFNVLRSKDCIIIQKNKNGLDPNDIDSISIHTQDTHINNLQTNTLKSMQNDRLLIPNVDEMHTLIKEYIDFINYHTESKEQQDLISNISTKSKNLPQITDFIRLESINLQSLNIGDLKTLNKEQIQHLIKYELIESLAKTLINNTSIILQRNSIVFTLSLKNTQNKIIKETPFILFATLDSAQSYLRMSEAQKSMLVSFEKPFISIQCKEVFINEFGTNTIFAGLSCDIIVVLLLLYLQEKYEISYLFYTPQIDFVWQDSIKKDSNKNSLESIALLCYTDGYPYSYTNKTKMLESTYSVAEHIYLSHLQTHKNLYSLLKHNKTKSARFISFLSTTHNSQFLIEKTQDAESSLQRILDISFSTDLYRHLEVLHGYKNGNKLIYNFTKANIDIVSKWNLTQLELEKLGIHELIISSNVIRKQCLETNNLLDISILIKQILDIESNIINYANSCVRDRGPRIDYKLIRVGDSIVLDYARILRSVMSFQLAGVENELLCYGVIDSLAEFIGTLASDMMLNYGIQEVFICGDLLLKQCFLDKIIKAVPKNMNATFARFGGTDYLD